jgi:hypothetical protein
MTEGDMIGIPRISDDVTQFLPVDWFKQGCDNACNMLLDELNRATPEIMNAAFQIVLDREMNGNKLHPGTRVIACVNAGSNYSVNEMDLALLNRFAIFHFAPTAEDWLDWAASADIDPVIIEFIRTNRKHLRNKDIDSIQAMSAHPTPRSWGFVNNDLKYAGMAPIDCAGQDELPAGFYQLCTSLVGVEAASAFVHFVQKFERNVSAEDILDNYDARIKDIEALSHDAVVSVIDKLGEHLLANTWTEDQFANLERFSKMMSGEDYLTVFKHVAASSNMDNIQNFHKTSFTKKIMDVVDKADALKNQS